MASGKRPPSALWLAHKPQGVTSASVVRDLHAQWSGNYALKMSHGGVLDPFAHGLLLILVGAANKLFEAFHEVPKTYIATIQWGQETDTGDSGGKIVFQGDAHKLSSETLEAALAPKRGWTMQQPPATSNKRIDGERAYVRAHRGEDVSVPQQQVYLHSARWLAHQLPHQSRLEVVVRGGFYVRSLAIDLGRAVNEGATLLSLERTAIGPYADVDVPQAFHGHDVLPWLPWAELSDAQWGALRQGQVPIVSEQPARWPLPQGFPSPSFKTRFFHRGRLVAVLGKTGPVLLPGGL